jgi:beta-glucosidase
MVSARGGRNIAMGSAFWRGDHGSPDGTEPDDVELRALVAELTVQEKARLLTGADFWTLHPVPRIGLRPLVLSDGPNGVRGPVWDERDTSLLLPVASAVAATWDRSAARRVGELFGDEARRRGVHVVLAPTVNVHRSPFGGRHFENFSEDPRLIAEIGAGVVAGIQEREVAATPKHFVANDSETARLTYDAMIDEATLREVYLAPFEHIVAEARPWAIMSAYNSVNGRTMTENSRLVNDVLKTEWAWDGLNMSDWFAARDLDGNAHGGLDLAMPGPDSPWSGGRLARAVEDGRVAEDVLDAKVLRLLRLAARTGALGPRGHSGENPATPPAPSEQTRPEIRALAAQGFVLLRNEGRLLPLDPPGLRKVAVMGENATIPAVQGGGSSHVSPPHVVTPLDGVREALPDATVVYQRGASHRRLLDTIPGDRVFDPDGSGIGLRVDYLDGGESVLASEVRGTERLLWLGTQSLPEGTSSIRLRGQLRIGDAGEHLFGMHGTGTFRVEVSGREVFSGDVAAAGIDDPLGDMIEPPEQRISVVLAESDLDVNGAVPVRVDFTPRDTDVLVAVGLGYQRQAWDEAAELSAAVDAARDADVAVVVVGTNDEVETEGRDRDSLGLPGNQDELVRAVVAANPRTVVVVNAGSPVLMPWAAEVPAVLWTWFGSQEYGDALADVLLGAAEPGGRLPTTFPAALADVPVPLAGVRPVGGKLHYAEGTLIGHRAYAAAGVTPGFHFGHGLGYTTWEYADGNVESADDGVRLRVAVRNTGDRGGREVVQVYTAGPDGQPPRLTGFTVVEVEAGSEAKALVEIPQRALARYDAERSSWTVPPGEHRFLVGRSAGDIRLILGAEIA